MLKYLNKPMPPTCLHVLGQDLTNSLHKEGRLLYLTANRICLAASREDADALDRAIEHMKLLVWSNKPLLPTASAAPEGTKLRLI